MTFIWPQLLFLLICAPLLVLLYARMLRRRRETAARFNALGFAQGGMTRAGARRHIPAIAFLLGITVLLTSAARPQAPIALPRLEGTVILTFDVSGSMSADDMEPTRMEAAKAAARAFVEDQPSSVLIGVVAFSDGGLSIQSPTNVKEETLATIDRLEPKRGTSLANGILVALNLIATSHGDPSILQTSTETNEPTPLSQPQGWYTSSMIVLLSDGENNQNPDPLIGAELAADLGVRIYTIGVGSLMGDLIEVEGFTVHTQLDEALLKTVSEETGGEYYFAADEEDLNRIYDDLKPKLTVRAEEMEVTAIFAGLGFVILLIGGLLSFLWFGHVP
jgi:Ca-activated chloride channel family protein